MAQNTVDIRTERAEQDIKTLRKTQNRRWDRIDSFHTTLIETRDIAAENRRRLERVEDRLDALLSVAPDNRGLLLKNRGLLSGNRDLLLKNRDLLAGNHDLLLKNHDLLLKNRDLLLKNHELLLENRALILENRQILYAIAHHLGVAIEKPDSAKD